LGTYWPDRSVPHGPALLGTIRRVHRPREGPGGSQPGSLCRGPRGFWLSGGSGATRHAVPRPVRWDSTTRPTRRLRIRSGLATKPPRVTGAPPQHPGNSTGFEGQYASALTTSPLARVPIAHQVGRLMVSLTNRTLPSVNRTFTPPGWEL